MKTKHKSVHCGWTVLWMLMGSGFAVLAIASFTHPSTWDCGLAAVGGAAICGFLGVHSYGR